MEALFGDFHMTSDKLRDDRQRALRKPPEMTTELRCEGNVLYGILSDDHKRIEVRCRKYKCGYAPGVIILHTIDLETGKVVHTQWFREPQLTKE